MFTPLAEWFPEAPFDGRYGFNEETLRTVEPVAAPPGFAEFWRAANQRTRAADPAPALTPLSEAGSHAISIVSFHTWDGLPQRAWLAVPTGEVRIGIVHGHGYGGRAEPDLSRVPEDAVAIFPVARGLGELNSGVGAPAEKVEHILDGIGSIDTYILGKCAADIWTAQNILDQLFGPLPHYYIGESFGGGVGALALPWDDRFFGATLLVPSFGQYDQRLARPCQGSGEAVRDWVTAHPEAREVLRWFDASTSATFSSQAVRVEAALWDTFVPPPGQFGVANGFAAAAASGSGAELELFVQPAGHAEYDLLEQVRQVAREGGIAHLSRVWNERIQLAAHE